MTSQTDKRRIRLLLLMLSTVFALAIVEAGTRLVVKKPVPSSSVMYSSRHWRLDDRGAVRHIPNETVRLVSVFDEAVEFDVLFRTNNLGLVDHRDYPVASGSGSQYAFVGDSFTHGMGAEPWVPKLRDELRAAGHDLEIYNLGVNGASAQHFRKLLLSVAEELPLSHIVIITISNDFLRPWWVPVETAAGGLMCRDPPACESARPLPPIIDRAAPADELIDLHRAMRAEAAKRQPVDALWRRALWQSELYLLVRRTALGLIQRFAPPAPPPTGFVDLEDPQLLTVNLEALAGIRTDFPNLPITLAHFPQIGEIEAAEYEFDFSAATASARIDYFQALTQCEWSVDMYHRVNSHPNAAGYRNFARCLSRHLFNH
jgi:hypothetical protein